MPATTIRLTSKRQATFPRELCEELGLEPGDELELIPRVEDGEKVWVIQRTKKPERLWLGSLKKYGEVVSNHSLESIRESIRAGRSRSEAR